MAELERLVGKMAALVEGSNGVGTTGGGLSVPWSRVASQATRSRSSPGVRIPPIGGMGEAGGVMEAMSLRVMRRDLPAASMSRWSGVSASRLPVRVEPFLKSMSTAPKPGAMTAPGEIMDSRK